MCRSRALGMKREKPYGNTHYDHDLQSTPAYRAYGFSLITPGLPNWVDTTTDRFNINKRKPARRKEFLSPDWNSATHAYVRILQRKHKLSPLFRGPFPILERQPRSMLLDIDGNLKRVSYLHLHPIRLQTDDTVTSDSQPPNNEVTSDSQLSNKEVTSDSPPSNKEATSDLRTSNNEVTSDSQGFFDNVTSDSQVYIIATFSSSYQHDMRQVVDYVTTKQSFLPFFSSLSPFYFDISTNIKCQHMHS